MGLLLLTAAPAGAELPAPDGATKDVDFNDEAGGGACGPGPAAQVFQPSVSGSLVAVDLMVVAERVALVGGDPITIEDVDVRIVEVPASGEPERDQAGSPVYGDVLATSVPTDVVGSTTAITGGPGADPVPVRFTFLDGVELVAGTHYAVLLDVYLAFGDDEFGLGDESFCWSYVPPDPGAPEFWNTGGAFQGGTRLHFALKTWMAVEAPTTAGYWMVGATGDVYAFGAARWFGNADVGGAVVVDIESAPDGDGYWVVDDHGQVFSFGSARYHGGMAGLAAGERTSSLVATASGEGYWLFTNLGRVASFGDAVHLGDLLGLPLQGPVLDATRTGQGAGYWMVASDGGVFSFGAAQFHGSMGGQRLNGPVTSMAPDADGAGYWLVATDGGVFAFDAPFRGSMGGMHLNRPMVGIAPYGDGYLTVAADGGIFSFSDQPFFGSLGGSPPAVPIVGVTTTSSSSSG